MILSFALTEREFLAGIKTVTRRKWKLKTFRQWQRMWDTGRLEHDAWNKCPAYGGRHIGRFKLTARPYVQRLRDMPVEDLRAEGGMCSTREEFCQLVKLPDSKRVAVIRFEKIAAA